MKGESGTPAQERAALGPSASVLRRRQVAAQARRRRLLLADVALGAVVALLALVLGPGLAPAAIGALLVLGGCAVSLARERRRRHRGTRPRPRARTGTEAKPEAGMGARPEARTGRGARRYGVGMERESTPGGEPEPWT